MTNNVVAQKEDAPLYHVYTCSSEVELLWLRWRSVTLWNFLLIPDMRFLSLYDCAKSQM